MAKVIPIRAQTDTRLRDRLRREVDGEVYFDAASRGRYATDASIYQIMPLGVVVPRTPQAARTALQIAVEQGVAILPRGAGTSQCGQTVGAALVIDNSKYLNRLVEFDKASAIALVQPGMVLDQLNAWLRPHGVWFPVDVSTAAQATIGGMAGNNSCGSRSIHYGNMVHNVLGIDAWLPSGELAHFGAVPRDVQQVTGSARYKALCASARELWQREKDEIAARFPQVQRRVAGYNLDYLAPDQHNMARLLVGSEGTLAYFERIHLKLAPLPKHRLLGVCHFPCFYDAMQAAQHIVKLQPVAVELVDRTMIELSRSIDAFRATVDKFLRGAPDAILLVEFAADDAQANQQALQQLDELMGDLGFPGAVVKITDAKLQREVWEVRKAGLNIMMSMKGDGKPVSFIEDCAVPLEHLAEYTRRLSEVFAKHGTKGTWYAHASVGCLHVRPVLDMRRDGEQKMRAIAEEACAMVREYKGAYSGEHGDGLVRSEWIEPFFGSRLTAVLGEIKSWFDPQGLMNPGKIVKPTKMDQRTLFRYPPDYATQQFPAALDWRHAAPGGDTNGFDKAVEMCNNNGHCRKFDAGTMCPSYRVTRDEQHLTRGRANTLRLALAGEFGANGMESREVKAAMDLCVSCKGCRSECPTGVDMAKMKIEVAAQHALRYGTTLRNRIIAYLPRYAPHAARLKWVTNAVGRLPLLQRALGFAPQRSWPQWRRPFLQRSLSTAIHNGEAGEVALFVDTFTNYFEPDNAYAALRVLQRAGYRVHVLRTADGARPLCCGRTFLAAGLVEQARIEARRSLRVLSDYAQRGVPIVGLEPSCMLGFRDEYQVMGLGGDEAQQIAGATYLFEEFIAQRIDTKQWQLTLKPLPTKQALLHGHCHQKAFGVMSSVQRVLSLVPELHVELIESSCCGMAGQFGYEREHYDVSLKMAELSLLPRVRAAASDALIVADGTSCRQQIWHGGKRCALHVAQVLDQASA